ncbi:hypothetical protein SCHPADRAFT_896860 [Schizopora paradoxa]|uniref:Uncharacterized protein n=1 Tax=Schizopora paradoxa TaxID=27342 RepID=A0A0H2RII9_9AGAM|nr:hypothetical protein SCHPADRAFT_896860 [Schizopora paradoxa]
MSNDQHNALVRSDTFSSTTHSTATSPDVVGPGRTLGLLFDWLGKNLEMFLNKRASQLKLGPEAVARDIRRIRRHEETTLLVRRSHVQSTQMKALGEIVKLSVEDPLIREALCQLNAGYRVPNYKEVELSIAISKAIHSMTYSETHELWTRFLFSMRCSDGFSNLLKHFESLTKSFSNPDSSYLAARYFVELVERNFEQHPWYKKLVAQLTTHYFDLTITSPSLIEWSNVNACGMVPVHWDFDEKMWLSRPDIIVEFISERQVAKTIVVPKVESFSLLRQLLKALTGSNDYLNHLTYIRSRDGQTQKAMKDIFIGNEILVAFGYILKHIEEKGLAGNGYECLLNESHGRRTSRQSDSNPQSKYGPQFKSIRACNHSFGLSLQCKLMLHTWIFSVLNSWTTDTYWNIPTDLPAVSPTIQMCCGDVAQTGNISFWLLYLFTAKVPAYVAPHSYLYKQESPFNSTSHYLILAFYDDSGVPFYLAAIHKPIYPFSMRYFFTSVKDGDTVATWYDEHGRANTTNDFMILVLRHDPVDFPIGRNDYPWKHYRPRTGALDPTGPIYWLQYFPETAPDFFEDIKPHNLQGMDKIILSQNGESAIMNHMWLRDNRPCSCWRCRNEVKSCSSTDHMENDDDSEPNVSSLGSDAEEYYNEAESESPLDEAAGPRMDGQSFPSWNEDSEIREDITVDEERSIEAEKGLDIHADPISDEDISIERLRQVIEERDLELEEKNKEIERLRAMLSKLRLVAKADSDFEEKKNWTYLRAPPDDRHQEDPLTSESTAASPSKERRSSGRANPTSRDNETHQAGCLRIVDYLRLEIVRLEIVRHEPYESFQISPPLFCSSIPSKGADALRLSKTPPRPKLDGLLVFVRQKESADGRPRLIASSDDAANENGWIDNGRQLTEDGEMEVSLRLLRRAENIA